MGAHALAQAAGALEHACGGPASAATLDALLERVRAELAVALAALRSPTTTDEQRATP